MFQMPGSKSKAPLRTVPVLTASLAADVALNNTGTFFDGPSVAQGPVGTWYASGGVVVYDTAGAATFAIKLWDGATLIDSKSVTTSGANIPLAVSLSGPCVSPTGNIRISVRDATATTGKIAYNQSALAKDSTLTVLRIG